MLVFEEERDVWMDQAPAQVGAIPDCSLIAQYAFELEGGVVLFGGE